MFRPRPEVPLPPGLSVEAPTDVVEWSVVYSHHQQNPYLHACDLTLGVLASEVRGAASSVGEQGCSEY